MWVSVIAWLAPQGDAEEETGCPPLFEFASAGDAEALESIAEVVLSPEDDPDGARCGHSTTLEQGGEAAPAEAIRLRAAG